MMIDKAFVTNVKPYEFIDFLPFELYYVDMV